MLILQKMGLVAVSHGGLEVPGVLGKFASQRELSPS